MIYEYDGSTEQCPTPLINLRLILKKMVIGDKCVIKIKDEGSLQDIPKFLSQKGYQFDKQTVDGKTIILCVNA